MALTKDQIAAIKADPSLASLYDALNADYTQKTQALSDDRKDLEQRLEEAIEYGNSAADWISKAEPLLADLDTRGNQRREPSTPRHDGNAPDIKLLVDRLAKLETFIQRATQDLGGKLEGYDRMFDLNYQLGDLRDKYKGKDINVKKVLKYALDKNLSSLDDAYMGAYRDDLIGEEADKRAQAKIDEFQASRKTEDGSRASAKGKEVLFRLPDDRPHTMGEATQSALSDLATGKLTDEAPIAQTGGGK